ncbi:MAG: LD-carboxypeptidase [Planctomycetota bacterium]
MRLLLTAAIALMCSAPASRAQQAEEPAPRKPPALSPGDTIMFVAPSGLLTKKLTRTAAARLEAMGYKVAVPEEVFDKYGYLAGTDEQRAELLNRALTDPEIDAVFPARGGYGMTRIVDKLDWPAIISGPPKIVIGFSDITGLHLALAAKANWVTFHSPNPEWGLGSDDGMPEFAANYFWRSLLAEQNTGEDGFAYELAGAWPADKTPTPMAALRAGVAEGRLIGGNLSLVAALMGTPYMPSFEGRVLFLEDINEEPYRVDRMLSTLRLAGQLDGLAGVLLGQFTKCDAEDGKGLSLAQVFDDYFGEAPYPVITNFPAGHVPLNAALPMGCRVRVDADNLKVTLLENAVTARPADAATE